VVVLMHTYIHEVLLLVLSLCSTQAWIPYSFYEPLLEQMAKRNESQHLIEDCRDRACGFPTLLERFEPCSQHNHLCWYGAMSRVDESLRKRWNNLSKDIRIHRLLKLVQLQMVSVLVASSLLQAHNSF